MKIETKFELGTIIWFIYERANKVHKGRLTSVNIDEDISLPQLYGIYDYDNYGSYIDVNDFWIFATREEAEAKLKEIQAKESIDGKIDN